MQFLSFFDKYGVLSFFIVKMRKMSREKITVLTTKIVRKTSCLNFHALELTKSKDFKLV